MQLTDAINQRNKNMPASWMNKRPHQRQSELFRCADSVLWNARHAPFITFFDFFFSAFGFELAILQSLVHFYKHQTANTLHPIFPNMIFSYFSTRFESSLCLSVWVHAPTTEVSTRRDGGREGDKSGCSWSWREKRFGKKWTVTGTKAQCSVNKEKSSKCYPLLFFSLSDTPFSLLFIFLTPSPHPHAALHLQFNPNA